MAKTSNTPVILALDVMGGDCAPRAMIEGASLALKSAPELRFLLCGDQTTIQRELREFPALEACCEIRHSAEVIGDDEKVATAIRRGRNTSMAHAIRAVKAGEAAAAVSSGNTGVLMAMSKLMLRMLPGIERPAIGTVLPHKHGRFVMLDLGANVTCDANNLFEFAVMGDAFARSLLNLVSPKIGLLNIGSEEMKGHDAVRGAAEMLRDSELPLNFCGYVEGDDIARGVVDVIVADGFTGNVALKTIEGTAELCATWFKTALTESVLSRIGALFLMPAIKRMKAKMDPRKHNGAMFLGLNGIIVKSHGGSDEVGSGNAINVAHELVAHRINDEIMREMVESGHIPPEDSLDGDWAEGENATEDKA